MTASKGILRRYTDLASLLDMLHRREITLLPPSTWDDRNDRLLMETYRKAKGLETLLALCMSERAETYHHWKVFTDRNNGVCILFHRAKLIDAMKHSGVSLRKMSYLKYGELDPVAIPTARLPYLKRFAFKDEGEVRAVYENAQKEPELKKVPFDWSVIEGIALNPWMAKPVSDSVIKVIEGMTLGVPFNVARSSLIESRVWRKFAENYAELNQS